MKIAVISGSRADWSGLDMVSTALEAAGHIIATWYLSRPGDDSPFEVSHHAARCVAKTTVELLERKPDLVLLNGDRSELLGAAVGAYLMRVPIAHMSGGDVTRGSADDQMRDAISMLATLHFATNTAAFGRLLTMLPKHRRQWVHFTGSPAIDRIVRLLDVSRETAFEQAGFPSPKQHNVMLVVHPPTGEGAQVLDEVDQILAACRAVESDLPEGSVQFLVLSPNADTGCADVERKLESFCSGWRHAVKVRDNPPDVYLQALRHCDVILGNSSSGIYEAPALGVWTVNVGDRQDGRPRHPSVIDVPARAYEIEDALKQALVAARPAPALGVFGDGTACSRIVSAIDNYEKQRRP